MPSDQWRVRGFVEDSEGSEEEDLLAAPCPKQDATHENDSAKDLIIHDAALRIAQSTVSLAPDTFETALIPTVGGYPESTTRPTTLATHDDGTLPSTRETHIQEVALAEREVSIGSHRTLAATLFIDDASNQVQGQAFAKGRAQALEKPPTDHHPTLGVFDIPSSASSSGRGQSLSSRTPTSRAALSTPTTDIRLETPLIHDLSSAHVEDVSTGSPITNERRFRARNPVQLHPYQFDRQRYHQTLHGTGYRPVHVADGHHASPKKKAVADTGHESDSSAFSINSDSSSALPIERAATTQGATPAVNAISDGFADMHPHERQFSFAKRRLGNKRQKTAHPAEGRPHMPASFGLSPLSSDSESSPLTRMQVDPKGTSSTDVSRSRTRRRKGFRMPPKIWSPSKSTKLSGEREDSSRSALDLSESGSDIEDVLPRRRLLQRTLSEAMHDTAESGADDARKVPGERSEESQSSDYEDHEQTDLMRHRIRGVLPASYLRIDQLKQRQDQLPHKMHPANTKSPARGIAHRVPKTLSRMPQSLDISREESAEVEVFESITSSPPALSQHEGDNPLGGALNDPIDKSRVAKDLDDVMEEDWIDLMKASLPRNTTAFSRPKMKRQIGLAEAFQGVKPHPSARSISSYSRSHIHGDAASRAKRPVQMGACRRAPQLSILDAVDASPETLQPDFVRVAMRQVRNRRDKGRHSPDVKLLCMHSREEAMDMESTIRDWNSGSIRRSAKHASIKGSSLQRRAPLKEMQQPPAVYSAAETPFADNQSRSLAFERQDGNMAPNPKQRTPRQTLLVPSVASKTYAIQRKFSAAAALEIRPSSTSKRSYQRFEQLYVRPGVLEEAGEDERSASVKGRPRIRLPSSTKNLHLHAKADSDRVEDLVMSRFMHNEDGVASPAPQPEPMSDVPEPRTERSTPDLRHKSSLAAQGSRRRLKQRPVQLHVEDDHEQFLVNLRSPVDLPTSAAHSHHVARTMSFAGLAAMEMPYTTDFGIGPLPSGICFHQNTFIGSGELGRAMTFSDRDLSVSAGYTPISLDGSPYRLGPWTEETDYAVSEALKLACKDFSPSDPACTIPVIPSQRVCPEELMRSLVGWTTHNLSFLRLLDRNAFVVRLTDSLRAVVDELPSQTSSRRRPLYHFAFYLLVLLFQLLQLCKSHDDATQLSSIRMLVHRVAQWLAAEIISCGGPALRQFHNRSTLQRCCEVGVKDEGPVSALVGLNLILEEGKLPGHTSWSFFDEALSSKIPQDNLDLSKLEIVWHTLFSILPFFDIDRHGSQRRNNDGHIPGSAWATVNRLMSPLLLHYTEAANATASNMYFRALLTRCFTLVRKWHWPGAEVVAKGIFDFFARRSYSMLSGEDVGSQTTYLESLHLSRQPKLESCDRSFQIFLKLLALAMQQLFEVPEKKARGTVFRFMPNHGRTHHKEQELRQDVLCAFRNQHELLAVLYCSSPPMARPKVGLMSRWVDLETSHAEVCRLNIRTWANVTRFQLSTSEPLHRLHDLSSWFNSILGHLAHQHKVARTEAESSYAKYLGTLISKESVEHTISVNQRTVQGLIATSIGLLTDLLKQATTDAAVQVFFSRVSFEPVMDLYEPGFSRLHPLICDIAKTYEVCAGRLLPRNTAESQSGNSSESQDFGDFPDADVLDELAGVKAGAASEEHVSFEPLQRLLSNCFGADQRFEDTLLESLVSAWVAHANLEVARSRSSWDPYLDEHGTLSWSQLRSTEASQQYFPLYLAMIVTRDKSVINDHQEDLMRIWLTSLVEHESSLKFQHRLTSSLLNAVPSHALLRNLPFVKDTRSGMYHVTLEELRTRRLQLLSTVLANMQGLYYQRNDTPSRSIERGLDLKLLLRRVMSTMQAKHEELGFDAQHREVYVRFVHAVVQMLQQYTSEILQVDRYFTDDKAFPLPSDDPMYVVGKLKSYVPRLGGRGTQSKLLAFLHSIIERAAADGKQKYLEEQIHRSLAGEVEDASSPSPSLRRVLVQGIFPAYIHAAFSSDCGWILAAPILSILKTELDKLLYMGNMRDGASMGPSIAMTETYLAAANRQVDVVIQEPEARGEAHKLKSLHMLLGAAASIPRVLDLAHRLSPSAARAAVASLIRLRRRVDVLIRVIDDGRGGSPMEEPGHGAPQTPAALAELHSASVRELQQALSQGWRRQENVYLVKRGQNWRPVGGVEALDVDSERAKLEVCVFEFTQACKRALALPCGERGIRAVAGAFHKLHLLDDDEAQARMLV